MTLLPSEVHDGRPPADLLPRPAGQTRGPSVPGAAEHPADHGQAERLSAEFVASHHPDLPFRVAPQDLVGVGPQKPRDGKDQVELAEP